MGIGEFQSRTLANNSTHSCYDTCKGAFTDVVTPPPCPVVQAAEPTAPVKAPASASAITTKKTSHHPTIVVTKKSVQPAKTTVPKPVAPVPTKMPHGHAPQPFKAPEPFVPADEPSRAAAAADWMNKGMWVRVLTLGIADNLKPGGTAVRMVKEAVQKLELFPAVDGDDESQSEENSAGASAGAEGNAEGGAAAEPLQQPT